MIINNINVTQTIDFIELMLFCITHTYRIKEVTIISNIININKLSIPISNVISNQHLSVITSLKQKAIFLEKSGNDILNLSGGDPSHVPEQLLSILSNIKVDDNKAVLNYSPIAGYDNLRSKIALISSERYINSINAENILVCSGGCSGLFLTFKTILNPNDKVFIQDPCWEYLPKIIENCGGIPVKLKFNFSENENDWEGFVHEIEKSLQADIKAVVINSPLNPTGKIIPKQIISQIAHICNDNNVWFVSDDVTVDFNYTPHINIPINNLANYISVNSFSKNLGITGLRCGYVIGTKYFIDNLKKSQLYTFMYPNSLIQKVLDDYFSYGLNVYFDYIEKIVSLYKQKASAYAQLLSSNKALEISKPDGGLFLFPKIRTGYYLDYDKLLNDYLVTVSPGYAFSPQYTDYFRIFLGISEFEMKCFIDRIAKYFSING